MKALTGLLAGFIFLSIPFLTQVQAQMSPHQDNAESESGSYGNHPGNNPMMGGESMGPGMYPSMGESGHGYGKGHWMKPHNAAAHFLEMKDVIGLNDKQVGDLKALRDAYRNENSINETKLRNAEEELAEILQEDAIPLDKAEAKIKEIGALEGPLWTNFVRQLAKIKSILTKDQVKKLHEMRRHSPMTEMK
ncbi:MAG TPA: hypothetical protein VN944_04105 [Nitrospiria bacterium]|nr:hypothetical protein [Nitrospiria bacterium]